MYDHEETRNAYVQPELLLIQCLDNVMLSFLLFPCLFFPFTIFSFRFFALLSGSLSTNRKAPGSPCQDTCEHHPGCIALPLQASLRPCHNRLPFIPYKCMISKLGIVSVSIA